MVKTKSLMVVSLAAVNLILGACTNDATSLEPTAAASSTAQATAAAQTAGSYAGGSNTAAQADNRDQGYIRIQNWGEQTLADAYHEPMGTQIVPALWFLALEADDGKPLASKVTNYGFLPSDVPADKNPLNLPIGFAINEDPLAVDKFGESKWLGVNCAGCHTTELNIAGKKVIIDGAATMLKLNQFNFDLVEIVRNTLQDGSRFSRFKKKLREVSDAYEPGYSSRKLKSDILRPRVKRFARDFQKFLDNNHTEWHSKGGRPHAKKVILPPGSLDALTLGGNMAAGCNFDMFTDDGSILSSTLEVLGISDAQSIEGRAINFLFANPENCQPANVPVNIPHLWGTNNFKGGHYAAEETNVTGRNFGAAMTGFGANRMSFNLVNPSKRGMGEFLDAVGDLDKDAAIAALKPKKPIVFQSTVTLQAIDTHQKWYDVIDAPNWDALVAQGVVNPMSQSEVTQAEKGMKTYNQKCAACHGAYEGDLKTGSLQPVALTETNRNGAQFWDLVRVPTKEIGTDPSRNNRDGIESGKILPKLFRKQFLNVFPGIATDVLKVTEDAFLEKGEVPARFYRQFYVLATLKEHVTNFEKEVYDRNNLMAQFRPDDVVKTIPTPNGDIEVTAFQAIMTDDPVTQLMGCRSLERSASSLVAADAYKARPLDGIVFTAPYLHNGSVPTLTALLTSEDKRPQQFEVGCTNYDIENMGFACDSQSKDKSKSFNAEVYDTTKKTNSNKGHSGVPSSDWIQVMVDKGYPNAAEASYGTDDLTDDQKKELIQFLKNLKALENPVRGNDTGEGPLCQVINELNDKQAYMDKYHK